MDNASRTKKRCCHKQTGQTCCSTGQSYRAQQHHSAGRELCMTTPKRRRCDIEQQKQIMNRQGHLMMDSNRLSSAHNRKTLIKLHASCLLSQTQPPQHLHNHCGVNVAHLKLASSEHGSMHQISHGHNAGCRALNNRIFVHFPINIHLLNETGKR